MQEQQWKEEAIRRSGDRSTPLPGLGGARRRRGMSQRELAVLAGVGSGTISALEVERRGGYPRTIKRLADALETEVAQLIEG